MKMLNNNLLCEVEQKKTSTESGFEITDKFEFKTLKVLFSGEDDVKQDDRVEVKATAGKPHPSGDNVIIIHRTDIIFIH